MVVFADNKKFSAEELTQVAAGRLLHNSERVVSGISIDSRDVGKDSLFVAISGEKTDGHKYIRSAVESGASAILADEKIFSRMYQLSINGKLSDTEIAAVNIILVDDTVAALGRIAKQYLKELAPMVVAITGSVGKTTTKELIYSVVSQKMKAHKTEGNYNSVIGLPLTVMSMGADERALILEMGMSERGEISRLADIAQPDIAVVTNIGTSHIGILGSREAIRDAKMEIRDGMTSNSVLVLNGDEPLLEGYDAVYVAIENTGADILVENVREYTSENYTLFNLRIQNRQNKALKKYDEIIRNLRINSLGYHVVFDAAIAAAVGILLDINVDDIKEGLKSYYQNPMRQSISERTVAFENSGSKVTVIEDCYNASPESMKMALSVLETLKKTAMGNSKAIAVLGDMRELGEYSETLHKQVGKKAAEKADLLFTLGKDAANIAEGAHEAGMARENIFSFNGEDQTKEMEKLVCALSDTLESGDIVLFKASRAVALEQVIKKIFG